MGESVRIGGGIFSRKGGVTTLPLAAGPVIVDLVDSTLLPCLGCEGITPEDLFDLSLLLLEIIERSVRSTLGSLLLVLGFLVGSLLEVAICLIMAMDEPVVLAMVGTPVTILAFLGFLGAAFLRGVALALLILLGDTTSFYCLCSLMVPFLLQGFLEPLLLGSFLPILHL
jgi:hypothetical protein